MSTGDLIEVMRGISEKLDGILGFMAAKECKGDAALIVPKLKGLGISNKTIALVAGISENAVAIRVTRMKKPSSRKPTGKRKGKAAADATPQSTKETGTDDSGPPST